MIASYHNHTTWSDGTASVAALVERAGELGVDELGVSDHFRIDTTGHTPSWSMPQENLGAYVDEIRSFRGHTAPIVRLGLEVDWFRGQADTIRAALEGYAFDFLIGSVHEVDGFRIDSAPDDWNALSQDDQNDRHRGYWAALRTMAQSGLFDVAAHLDLPKKFGHQPTVDIGRDVAGALDAIAESGMVVELNTAGWHRPCRSGYPSVDILRECKRREIPVTLSSDAHEPDHLVRDFVRGARRLEEAGYDRVARFASRRRAYEPLETAVAGLE